LIRPELAQQLLGALVEQLRAAPLHSTTRSPRRPVRGDGTPRSRSAESAAPVCVPGGTRTPGGPIERRHLIFAPSAALWMATGTVHVQVVRRRARQRMRCTVTSI